MPGFLYGTHSSASASTVYTGACVLIAYVTQSADGAIDGNILISDDTTTMFHHGAGEGPVSAFFGGGIRIGTSLKVSLASANDRCTVVYLPI